MEFSDNLPDVPKSQEEKYNPFADPQSPYYREGGTFVPTRRNPIPARKCTAKKRKTGEPCQRWAVAGATVCSVHGGQLPRVSERAKAIQDAARLQLLDSVPDSIATIYTLAMDEDTPHAVRLKASTEILDRAGIKGGLDVNINVNEGTSPMDKFKDKLSSLRPDKPQELEDLGESEEIIEEDSN